MTLCNLCQKAKELKESHIIPKFLYRYMLSVTENKITQFDGRINLWQKSNRQLTKKLLCSDCEQILGKNETLFSEVFREINRNSDKSKFAFGELGPEDLEALESRGYSKAEINDFLRSNPLYEKIQILEFFSISYIYRELLNNAYSIPEYEVEKIRGYLLGVTELSFMLHVRVHDSKPDFNIFTTVIVMDGLDDWKHFIFYIPNMQFHIAMHVSGTPSKMAKTLIIPTDFKEDEIGSINLIRKFQKGSRVSKNLKK